MLTKEQAMGLDYRDELHFDNWTNSKGQCQVVRVNGQIKTWKTRPFDWVLPVKYGMGYRSQSGYDCSSGYNSYHLPSECPRGKGN